MNEIFNFHKQLNIAKVATVVFFAIIIISLAVIFFIPKNETPNKKLNTTENVKNENKPFEDKNQLISLTLDKSYGLVQYDSTQDYILELRSDNDLNIFIEKEKIIPDRILYNIVNKDKEIYIKEFSTTSNISDIREVSFTNGFKGYTYCFHYQDSKTKKPYYLQIIWAQGIDNYFVISIDFPLDKLTTFSGIINEIISKIKFN